jgi:hypothetical protein
MLGRPLSRPNRDPHQHAVRAFVNHLLAHGFKVHAADHLGDEYLPPQVINGRIPDIVGTTPRGAWFVGEAEVDFLSPHANEQLEDLGEFAKARSLEFHVAAPSRALLVGQLLGGTWAKVVSKWWQLD